MQIIRLLIHLKLINKKSVLKRLLYWLSSLRNSVTTLCNISVVKLISKWTPEKKHRRTKSWYNFLKQIHFMNKLLLCNFLLFLIILQVSAAPNSDLKFNLKGQFKIVQFTDTHIDLKKGSNLEWLYWRVGQNRTCIRTCHKENERFLWSDCRRKGDCYKGG